MILSLNVNVNMSLSSYTYYLFDMAARIYADMAHWIQMWRRLFFSASDGTFLRQFSETEQVALALRWIWCFVVDIQDLDLLFSLAILSCA